MQKKVICVRMDHNTAPPVQDFPVRENKYSKYWECEKSQCVCVCVFTLSPMSALSICGEVIFLIYL